MSTLLNRAGVIAQIIICMMVCIAFFGVIASIIFAGKDIPTGSREVLLVLVGVLASSFKDVVGYYFGSSLGSSKKDEVKQATP